HERDLRGCRARDSHPARVPGSTRARRLHKASGPCLRSWLLALLCGLLGTRPRRANAVLPRRSRGGAAPGPTARGGAAAYVEHERCARDWSGGPPDPVGRGALQRWPRGYEPAIAVAGARRPGEQLAECNRSAGEFERARGGGARLGLAGPRWRWEERRVGQAGAGGGV